MAINAFRILNEPFGQNALIACAPAYIDQRLLAANTAEDIAVPTGADIVIFASTVDFHCKCNASGARITGDIADGTAWDFNPTAYWLAPGLNGTAIATIRVESEAAGYVRAKFYKRVSS